MKRIRMFLGVIVMTTSFALAQGTDVTQEMQAAIEKAASQRLATDKAAWEAQQAQEVQKAALQAEMEAAGTEAGTLRETEDAMKYGAIKNQNEAQQQALALTAAEIEKAVSESAKERETADMILYSIQKNIQEIENQVKAQIDSEIKAAVEEAAQNRLSDDMFNYYKPQALIQFEEAAKQAAITEDAQSRMADDMFNYYKQQSVAQFDEAQKQAAIANAAQTRLLEDSVNYALAQYQLEFQKLLEAQIAAEIQAAIEKAAKERFANDSAAWAQYNLYHNMKAEEVSLTNNEVLESTITLQVYPNPAIDYINVDISSSDNSLEDGTSEITMIDLTGKLISKTNLTNNAVTIDLSRVRSGFYIIQYTGKNKNVTARFTKE